MIIQNGTLYLSYGGDILPVDTAASIAPTAANLVCQTPKMQAHLQKQHDP